MMKPDLKITIVYDEANDIVQKLHKLMTEREEAGYPIIVSESCLTMNNKSKQDFKQFVSEQLPENDIAIFIINNSKLRQSVVFGMGVFFATHNKVGDYFINCGTENVAFDEELSFISEFPEFNGNSAEMIADEIFQHLHENIISKRYPNYLDKKSYKSEIPNVLVDPRYVPQLKSLVDYNTSAAIKYAESLTSEGSSLDKYFQEESKHFGKNEKGHQRLVQYIVDRMMFMVYITDKDWWKINLQSWDCNLEKSCETAIKILDLVFQYQTFRGESDEERFTGFYAVSQELKKILENGEQRNRMLDCLLYFYLGSSNYNVAKYELAKIIRVPVFDASNKSHIEKIKQTYSINFKPVADRLSEAIRYSEKVIDLAESVKMDYIWSGYAKYNIARMKYILNLFNRDEYNEWKQDMFFAADKRKNYCKLYEKLPKIISHNLTAEYLKAKLDGCIYTQTELNSNDMKMYNDWAKDSLRFRDAIAVQNQYEKLNLMLKNDTSFGKVFIVHGHDDGTKNTVARVVEQLGLEAIILHEEKDGGKTIIEKIEKHSNVEFAIILYTPCDIGQAKQETKPQKRARQNVVFEHGYFTGKLGREKVCVLRLESDIEIPSDFSGVEYIPMDTGSWKTKLVDMMNSVGFKLDKNKLKD